MPSCSDLGDWNATNVCKCPLSLWLRSSAINKERRIFAQFIAFSQAVVKKAYGYWKDFLVRVLLFYGKRNTWAMRHDDTRVKFTVGKSLIVKKII